MTDDLQRILVTGSNGHLGRMLIAQLRHAEPDIAIRALVRSQRAAATLHELPQADQPQEVCIADYPDAADLERAAAGCQAIVHLVGIIKENANTSYVVAHQGSCQAIAQAAASAGVNHIVYLSLFGASPDSDNACLASRGCAEEILKGAAPRATIMRVPMVLGRGDGAAQALFNMSRGSLVPLMGGGATLQQPIDARDVIAAICAALRSTAGSTAGSPADSNRVLDLGGPESLPHRELLRRAAAITGGSPRFLNIPFAAVRGIAALLERLTPHPPLTRAWLGVLQHDDQVNSGPACKELGIELHSLDETLHYCLSQESEPA